MFSPGDGSIWLADPASATPRPVASPSPDLFWDAPAFSPDGRLIALVRSNLTAQGLAQYAIYTMDLDGGSITPLATPPENKISYHWPHFSDDGKYVYFTATTPMPPNSIQSEILRVPRNGGTLDRVVSDARMSTVSPDGSKIAFIRFNFDTFTGALWIANMDGSNSNLLVPDDVFAAIAAPQFSPDGSQILFAASGPNKRPLPGISLAPSRPTMPVRLSNDFMAANIAAGRATCTPFILCLLAEPARANGLPWDLWTVTSDGGKFTRLTELGADSPWPAWSRDGKQVAFFDMSGTYLLDLPTRVVWLQSGNGGHGVFDWWQPE